MSMVLVMYPDLGIGSGTGMCMVMDLGSGVGICMDSVTPEVSMLTLGMALAKVRRERMPICKFKRQNDIVIPEAKMWNCDIIP